MRMREGNVNATRKQVHSDRVTAVAATDDIIVTASHDQSVRVWDKRTLRQVGFFQCRAPVLSLALNPASSTDLVCGDDLGHVYFLRLRPFPSLSAVTGGGSLCPSETPR
ncbi:telomerase protein component 1-like [Rhinoraja longicauda]